VQLPVTTRETILCPIAGPPGLDLTPYTPQVALIADSGAEPLDADYHNGTWVTVGLPANVASPCPGLDVGPGAPVAYPQGFYMAWVRLNTGTAKPVCQSGRVRVGDPRL
jgi:hypothetical protein